MFTISFAIHSPRFGCSPNSPVFWYKMLWLFGRTGLLLDVPHGSFNGPLSKKKLSNSNFGFTPSYKCISRTLTKFKKIHRWTFLQLRHFQYGRHFSLLASRLFFISVLYKCGTCPIVFVRIKKSFSVSKIWAEVVWSCQQSFQGHYQCQIIKHYSYL